MAIILPFLISIYIGIGLSFIFKNKFGISLSAGYLMLIFIGYLGGLFNYVSFGFILFSIGILFLLIYKLKRLGFTEFIQHIKHVLSSKSFCYFVIIYVFVLIMDWQRGFNYYDEFMHWGYMAKETYRLNSFHIVKGSQMWFHKDYPGFVALFQSFWCMVSGSFQEAYCYRALHILTLIMFAPLFDDNKSFIKTFIITLLIVVLPLTVQVTNSSSDSALFYNSMYLDWLISIVAGLNIFYCLFKVDESFDLLLMLQIALILMTKQIGIFFAALGILLFVYRMIAHKRYRNLLFVIIPLFSLMSWNLIVNFYNEQGQFASSNIDINVLTQVLTNTGGEEFQIQCKSNFINSLLYNVKFNFPIPLTYFGYVILQIALILFLLKLSKAKFSYLVPAIYGLGSIVYPFILLVLYLFTFTEFEATSLASFNRYLQTYTLCGTTFISVLIIELILKFNSTKVILLLTLIPLLFIDYSSVSLSVPALWYSGKNDQKFSELLQVVDSVGNEQLLIVAQYIDLEYPMLRYYNPKYNYRIVTFGEGNLNAARVDVSQDDFLDFISEYDFLYTYVVNDEFLTNYWSLLNAEYLDQRLYRICSGSDDLILIDHINTIESTKSMCGID